MKRNNIQDDTLERYKEIIDTFDEVVNETPIEFKGNLSKRHFYTQTTLRLIEKNKDIKGKKRYKYVSVMQTIQNRDKYYKLFKERFGANANF